jgi:putative nucleotidyltransferase with HDIG domain
MNTYTLENIVNWFENYTRGYIESFTHIKDNLLLKQVHSRNVMKHAKEIAQSLNLNQEITRICAAAGLLHDIGRFEQYIRYQTFSDIKSVDHGDLGTEVLQQENITDMVNASTAEIICKAVRNHNKRQIPTDETGHSLLVTSIIRDADKIDIYRIVTEYYTNGKNNRKLTLDLPDTNQYSEKALKQLMSGKIVNKEDLTTVNDFKILQLSWIYDLNHQKSIDIILANNYIQTIIDTLPQNIETAKLKDLITASLNKMP